MEPMESTRQLPGENPINERRNAVNSGLSDSCNMRPVCRYYKKGTCQYGDRCRFSHCDTSKTKVGPIKKDELQSASTSTNTWAGTKDNLNLANWVNAPEFVPSSNKKSKSYAQIVNPNSENDEKNKLCPYEVGGVCTLPEGECQYLHSEMCDLCRQPALHPFNAEERKRHTQVMCYLFYFEI